LTSPSIAPYLGAVITPIELNHELESGKFRPAYYFFGSEDYRIKEAEKRLLKLFLPQSQLSTNYTTLAASKERIGDILMELSIVPMLGERQVFTINDVQSMSVDEIEKIFILLTPPDPNRIVIFTSPSSKLPRKDSKVLKFLEQKAITVRFDRLTAQFSEAKINAILKENQVSIDADARRILVMLGGGDVGGLTEETYKLVNYVGQGGTIKKEDVALLGSDYQSFQIYELAKEVALGRLDKAMEIIDFLLKQGERASALVFWMAEHFIDLYLVKNKKALSGRGRKTEWKYYDQVGLFDNGQLEKTIILIAEADSDLRNNVRPEGLIIEKLIWNICGLNQKK
jgi:DNA polymerase III delta subunit